MSNDVEMDRIIADLEQWRDRALQAETHASQLEELFALQRTRMATATRAWQWAHDKMDTFPDLGELLGWLLDEQGKATALAVSRGAKLRRMKRLCKARFEALHKTIRSLVAKREDMVERDVYNLRVQLLLEHIHELDARIDTVSHLGEGWRDVESLREDIRDALSGWKPYKDITEGGND